MIGTILKGSARAARKVSGKLKSRFAKIGEGNIILLDFRERTIRLPNGDIIKPSDILNFDQQTKTIVYRSPSGDLKVLTLQAGESLADKAMQALLQNLAKSQGREREGILYL